MRRGFSLLELLVVLAILAVVGGMAVPVVAAKLTRDKVDETRKELQTLVPAIENFWRDCRRFPATLSALESNVPAVAGWTGPYATALLSGRPGVDLSLDKDAWNQPYVLTAGSSNGYSPTTATNQITIKSGGPDRTAGTSDDLTQIVDVVFLRRDETLDELEILNAAIQAYNDQFLASAPLPTNLDQLLAALYNANLLPRPSGNSQDPLLTDGWGSRYAASPPNVTPVVRLASPNVAASTQGNSSTNGSAQGRGRGRGRGRG